MFPGLAKFGGGPAGGGGIVGSGMRMGPPGGGPRGGGGSELLPPCAISWACCASRAAVLRQRSLLSSPRELRLSSRFLRCLSLRLASRSAAASSSFSLRKVTCRPSLCILTLTETGGEATLPSRLLLRWLWSRFDGEPVETAVAAAAPASAGPSKSPELWWRRCERPLGDVYTSDPDSISENMSAPWR